MRSIRRVATALTHLKSTLRARGRLSRFITARNGGADEAANFGADPSLNSFPVTARPYRRQRAGLQYHDPAVLELNPVPLLPCT